MKLISRLLLIVLFGAVFQNCASTQKKPDKSPLKPETTKVNRKADKDSPGFNHKQNASEPEFPGGDEAIESYFEKALASVEIPHLQNLIVNLVIGSDGKVKSAALKEGFKLTHVSEATKHIKPVAIDAAILQAAHAMPAWRPAIQDQKTIEKNVSIPVLVYPAKEKEFIKNGQKEMYHFVEENPQYPGGEMALADYIKNNIKFPAGTENAEGLIVVRLIINRFGKIKDPVILKGFHPELEKEVLRVMSTSPNWQAGRNNGYPVDMYYNYPIRFPLSK